MDIKSCTFVLFKNALTVGFPEFVELLEDILKVGLTESVDLFEDEVIEVEEDDLFEEWLLLGLPEDTD